MLNMFKHLFYRAIPTVDLAAYMTTLYRQSQMKFDGFSQKLASLQEKAKRSTITPQTIEDTKETMHNATIEETSLSDVSDRVQEKTADLLESIHSCDSYYSVSNR